MAHTELSHWSMTLAERPSVISTSRRDHLYSSMSIHSHTNNTTIRHTRTFRVFNSYRGETNPPQGIIYPRERYPQSTSLPTRQDWIDTSQSAELSRSTEKNQTKLLWVHLASQAGGERRSYWGRDNRPTFLSSVGFDSRLVCT